MSIKAKKREKVYAKTNYLCWYCGINEAVTCDHKVALRYGGTDDEENLVGACKKCNGHKTHLSVEQYRQMILNGLVKITHIERMTKGGFFESGGLFYGERLASGAGLLSTPNEQQPSVPTPPASC